MLVKIILESGFHQHFIPCMFISLLSFLVFCVGSFFSFYRLSGKRKKVGYDLAYGNYCGITIVPCSLKRPAASSPRHPFFNLDSCMRQASWFAPE
jgi:hypothetical protein